MNYPWFHDFLWLVHSYSMFQIFWKHTPPLQSRNNTATQTPKTELYRRDIWVTLPREFNLRRYWEEERNWTQSWRNRSAQVSGKYYQKAQGRERKAWKPVHTQTLQKSFIKRKQVLQKSRRMESENRPEFSAHKTASFIKSSREGPNEISQYRF